MGRLHTRNLGWAFELPVLHRVSVRGEQVCVSCTPKSRTSIITDTFHLDAALPCVCVGAEEQCVYHLCDKYVFAGQMGGPDFPSQFGGGSEVKRKFDLTHTHSITALDCLYVSLAPCFRPVSPSLLACVCVCLSLRPCPCPSKSVACVQFLDFLKWEDRVGGYLCTAFRCGCAVSSKGPRGWGSSTERMTFPSTSYFQLWMCKIGW